jgi:hypothetical protein
MGSVSPGVFQCHAHVGGEPTLFRRFLRDRPGVPPTGVGSQRTDLSQSAKSDVHDQDQQLAADIVVTSVVVGSSHY